MSCVKTRNSCEHSIGNFEGTGQGDIFSCEWESNIKVGVIEKRYEVADWIQVEHVGV